MTPGEGLMDAPNQEAVGLDPPWVEGTGGDVAEQGGDPLAGMTKAELLAEAEARGVEADDTMTKAEITAALGAAS